jgi:DnaJ-class molecular chaperone
MLRQKIAKMDYHKLLEMAKETSANEIKKVCHKMIIKGRPAKNPGDKFPTSRTFSMTNKNRLLSIAMGTMHSTLL